MFLRFVTLTCTINQTIFFMFKITFEKPINISNETPVNQMVLLIRDTIDSGIIDLYLIF